MMDDKKLELAARAASDAAIEFILGAVADYLEMDKEAGAAEIYALLAGERTVVVKGASERAFNAAAEILEPELFGKSEGG